MASIGNVNVKVGMDSSELQTKAKEVNRELGKIDVGVRGLNENLAKNTITNRQWASEGKRAFASTRTEAERYAIKVERLNKLGLDRDTLQRALAAEKVAYEKVAYAAERAAKAEHERARAQQRAMRGRQIDTLRGGMRTDAARIYAESRTAAERYAIQVARLNALQRRGFLDTTTCGRAMARLNAQYIVTAQVVPTGAVARLSATMKAAGITAGGLAASLGLVGGALSVVYVGVAAFRALIRETEEFNKAMYSALAIAGDVSPKIRRAMVDVAREVAYETNIMADEVAKGYKYLISAGLDVKQSMAALPQMAVLAQAGMMDLGAATEMAARSQSALGMNSQNSAVHLANLVRVTDALTAGDIIAQTSVVDLATAVDSASADMRMVNMEIEEGIAVLMAYAKRGKVGAEAATMFSMALRELRNKAVQNAEAFKAAGIDVFDPATGKFRKMWEILGDLEKKLGALESRGKTKLFLELGLPARSVKGLQIIEGTSEMIRKFEEDVLRMGGVTQDVSDKQIPPLTQSIGAVKDAFLDVGASLMEAGWGDAASDIQDVADTVNLMAEGFRLVNAELDQFAMSPALKWFDKLADLKNPMKAASNVQEMTDYLAQQLAKRTGSFTVGEAKTPMGAGTKEFFRYLGSGGPADVSEELGGGAGEGTVGEGTVGEGMSEDLEKAQESIAKVVKELEKAVAVFGKSEAELRKIKVGKAMTEALAVGDTSAVDALERGLQRMTDKEAGKAFDDFAGSMEGAMDKIGKSDVELRDMGIDKFIAGLEKLGPLAVPLDILREHLRGMADEWERLGNTQTVTDMADAFEKGMGRVGKTAAELRRMDMEEKIAKEGVNGMEAERARRNLDNMEQAKSIAEKMDIGKNLTEQFRTPAEDLKKHIQDIQDLLAVGAIDAGTAERALRSYAAASIEQSRLPAALVKGTREEYNERVKMDQQDKGPMVEMLKAALEQLAEAKQSKGLLEEIAAHTGALDGLAVADAKP